MTTERIQGSDKIQRDGYTYKVGRLGRRAVREVAPRGSINFNNDGLSLHTESGKRRAGFRLEWIVLNGVLVLVLVIGVMLAWPWLVSMAGS